MMFVASPVAVAQEQPRHRWIAAWTGGMTAVPQRNVQVVVNRTVRMLALLSLGGHPTRIRLSNEYGERSMSIGGAAIAMADTGAARIDGSSRPVTFGGRRSIVIRPGGVVLSDPIDFTAKPLASVAVSLYLPDSTFLSTLHVESPGGPRRTYWSPPGDFADSARFRAENAGPIAWMFLSGVDVVNNDARGTIVVMGNSIAGGSMALEVGSRWPDALARRLLTAADGVPLGVVAATINGNRLLGGGRGQPGLARFDRDVLAQSGVTHVVVSLGMNDIAFSATEYGGGVTARDLVFGLTQLATRARERGLVAIVGTITPSGGSTYGAPARRFGADEEAMRSAVNDWIRTNRVFDGVIDFDACVRDPAHPARLLPAYDQGDHLHLNDTGNRAMGECIDLGLFRRRDRQ
jgi:lysophospholipase L1-like esterase